QLGNGLWVKGQVGPGPSADLERSSLGAGKQGPPLVAQAGVLRALYEAVVSPSKERAPKQIGEPSRHDENLPCLQHRVEMGAAGFMASHRIQIAPHRTKEDAWPRSTST